MAIVCICVGVAYSLLVYLVLPTTANGLRVFNTAASPDVADIAIAVAGYHQQQLQVQIDGQAIGRP